MPTPPPEKDSLLQKIFGKKKSPNLSELGGSGTSIFSGTITEDFNSEWQSPRSIDNVERMRRTSGLIAGLLKALKLPIRRAERMIESADKEDETANMHAEFIEWALFHGMETSFDDWLAEALNYLDYGFMVFEKVWGVNKEKNCIYLRKLATRQPNSIQKWETKDGSEGITQQLPAAKANQPSQPSIPMDKLLVLTFQKEGDNYEGISILRTSWVHYWYIDNLFRIQGIAAERYGAGTLKIKMPDAFNASDKTMAENMGKNFRVNEQSYMVLPKGWDVEIITPSGSPEGSNMQEGIKEHSKQIAISMLAQMVLLGSDGVGSYALSKDQSSFLLLGLQSIADQISDNLNRTVVKDLIDYNFGPQEKYPKFKIGDVGRIDFAEYSTAITTLVNSGLVTPDSELEEFLRKQFKMPQQQSLEEKLEEKAEEQEIKSKYPEAEEPEAPAAPVTPKEEPVDDEEDGDLSEAKKKIHADALTKLDEATWEAPRELTLAEQRVDFPKAHVFLKKLENDMRDVLKEFTAKQKELLFKKIEAALKGENVSILKDLSAPLTPAMKAKLKTAANEALNYGKQAAAREIKTTVPSSPARETQSLNQEIDDAIDERNIRLTRVVKDSARNAIKNGIGISAALLAASVAFDAEADKANDAISGRYPSQGLNAGRGIVFEKNEVDIHGLQRSEVLDEVVCAVCASLDGRVCDPKDAFTKLDQVHTNCRGIWVAAMKDDSFLPPVAGIPKSIRSKFETDEGVPKVNAFKQIPEAIVRKDSRAAERKDQLPNAFKPN